MTLQVPDSMVAQADCTPRELIFGLVGLFFQGRLTLGQAGEALRVSKFELMERLHEHGLPMPYRAKVAADDLATIERLWPRMQGVKSRGSHE